MKKQKNNEFLVKLSKAIIIHDAHVTVVMNEIRKEFLSKKPDMQILMCHISRLEDLARINNEQ